MNRREFFRVGLIGGAVLAVGRFAGAAAPAGLLSAEDRPRLAAIARVVLGPALPADMAGRVVDSIDAMVRNLPAPTQAELRDLLDLIGMAPARLLLAGFWSDWHEVPPAEVDAALNGWRTSRFALLRSAYCGLHELSTAAWYGDPGSWPRIGYPGPPEVERPQAALK
jgi:hypothetical protein